MDPSFVEQYRLLLPDQLLELGRTADELSDEARDALRAELHARGMHVPGVTTAVGKDSEERSRCRLHPCTDADQVCARCGDFLCADCVSVRTPSGAWCVGCADFADVHQLHYVPVSRLVVLTMATGGYYSMWWMYRYWSVVRQLDRSRIWPVPRAMLGGLFYFALLADLNRRTAPLGHAPLSLVWGVGLLAFSAGDMVPQLEYVAPLLAFLFLLPAAARIAAVTPERRRREHEVWRPRHIGVLCAGLCFWALTLWGLYLPVEL
jgi:hypothetical protein